MPISQDTRPGPTLEEAATCIVEDCAKYDYYVRLINPKKKSDFIVRMWHDEHSQFKSPGELKIELLDTFPGDIPTTENFQVGYFEPPCNTKRWIVDKRDLTVMYDKFLPDSTITLWCDRSKQDDSVEVAEKEPVTQKKNKRSDRADIDEETDDIFRNLKEKHPDMIAPKLRLWAKLIQLGQHKSYEDPPSIPLITGPDKPAKKESLTDAFSGAACAIVKALQKPTTPTTSKGTHERLHLCTRVYWKMVFLPRLNLLKRRNKY